MIFSCRRRDGKCSIKLQCRNNCPFCRLNKCLENGLKPELVLSGKNVEKTAVGDPSSLSTGDSYNSVPCRVDQPKPLSDASSSSEVSATTNTKEHLLQIPETHQLILSQTTAVNLLSIPTECTRKVEKRIKEAENNPEMINPDILLVAQMELAFLVAKECVSFFTESVTMDRMIKSQEKESVTMDRLIKSQEKESVSPAMMFTFQPFQEYFVQFMVIFLKNCPYFQSISWACQARLLR